MQAGRQTDRHTHHNTSHTSRGRSNKRRRILRQHFEDESKTGPLGVVAWVITKNILKQERLPRDACDRTIRHTHSLLLESPFVPSRKDCWAIRAKIRQKRPSRWP